MPTMNMMPVSSETSTSALPKVVIRCGHIIPSIRLTPPDSRPSMAPSVPEQDLGSSSLFVPLRTEEVGWEEGGLIWAAKRYFYPTVNLYGGSDDHIIGTYRGGPKGYRFVNITDQNFALANSSGNDDDNAEDEAVQLPEGNKTSCNGIKSALPKGPATKISSSSSSSDIKTDMKDNAAMEVETKTKIQYTRELPISSSSSSSSSSTPTSSRRGSSSTDNDDEDDGRSLSGADTGVTTPTSEAPCKNHKQHSDREMADELEAALYALGQDDDDLEEASMPPTVEKTTQLASRTGAGQICSEPVDVSRLRGPIKSQLYNNGLGYDRSLTLSDSVPAIHFQEPRGRSRSRRSQEAEYSAGWSYEQNMKQEHLLL